MRTAFACAIPNRRSLRICPALITLGLVLACCDTARGDPSTASGATTTAGSGSQRPITNAPTQEHIATHAGESAQRG